LTPQCTGNIVAESPGTRSRGAQQSREQAARYHAGPMDKLQALELKLDSLIQQCQQLAADNRNLREQESQWQRERQRLIKNNEAARNRVETMISRLKGLTQDN